MDVINQVDIDHADRTCGIELIRIMIDGWNFHIIHHGKIFIRCAAADDKLVHIIVGACDAGQVLNHTLHILNGSRLPLHLGTVVVVYTERRDIVRAAEIGSLNCDAVRLDCLFR